MTPIGRPLILAHRGDHRRWIENTADALIDACRLPGVDGVEFDVRAAGDGEPVVLHDETLERTFGVSMRARDVPALALMRVGVPHLADILELVPADAFVDIELKEPPTEATLHAIRAHRGRGLDRGVVSSFDAPTVAEVRARAPGWACWLNAVDLDRWSIATARAVGAVGISAAWPSVRPAPVAAARAAGLDVAAWTVRRRPTRQRLERLAIDAVIVEGAALQRDDGKAGSGTSPGTVPAPATV